MSGGLESGARAARRWEAYKLFIEGVLAYVLGSLKDLTVVYNRFQTDYVYAWAYEQHGFPWTIRFFREKRWASLMEESLNRLIAQDREEWTRLLYEVVGDKGLNFEAFKKASPFRDQMLVLVDYGHGFVSFGGELEKVISSLLKEKGHKSYGGQKYILVLPPIEAKTVEFLIPE